MMCEDVVISQLNFICFIFCDKEIPSHLELKFHNSMGADLKAELAFSCTYVNI